MGVTLAGYVAPGFEAVRNVFAENLEAGRDLGAAFAVTHEGRPVVDLYGGIADNATGAAWTSETLQVLYSGTKGLVALVVLMLVDRGLLDLEAPVAQVDGVCRSGQGWHPHHRSRDALRPAPEGPHAAERGRHNRRLADGVTARRTAGRL